MKSSYPKVLHKLGKLTMIEHLIEALHPLELSNIIIVTGYKQEMVQKALGDWDVEFVYQQNQLGTAHALTQARKKIQSNKFLLAPGDLPLVTTSSLSKFLEESQKSGQDFTLLTTEKADPTGYGRIVKDTTGTLLRIVEEQDATTEESCINEINTGIYLFKNDPSLWNKLDQLENDNAQGEYYLTDLVELYNDEGIDVPAFNSPNSEEFMGVNDKRDLTNAINIMKKRKFNQLMEGGVTIVDPGSTFIGTKVEIAQDALVNPFTMLTGKTVIGKRSTIGPHVEINDSKIDNDVEVKHSIVESSTVRSGAVVGPFQHIGPESTI